MGRTLSRWREHGRGWRRGAWRVSGRASDETALLGAEVPAFYQFPVTVTGQADSRTRFIETVYSKLNEVGASMPLETHARVVQEAKHAFRHNAAVYTEVVRPVPSLYVGAVLGALRIATGAVFSLELGKR